MVGIPSYETYVEHRRLFHPDEPIMSYEEFFKERQDARYATGKGRFRVAVERRAVGSVILLPL